MAKFNWRALANVLLTIFKQKAIKLIVLKIVGSCVGWQAYIVSFIAEKLYDYIAKPLAQLMIRKGLLVVDQREGRIKIRKLKDAEVDGDQNTYDTITDDIFS